MARIVRRFLVVAVLMFWQGGFTFYAAVVVPIGAEVLGSHRAQGSITRRVTDVLNIAGAVALPVLAWDVAAFADTNRRRRRLRWAIWGILAITLAALFWLHVRLDALLDAEQPTTPNSSFRWEHQQYLLISTVQWAASLACLALSLWTWRLEDTGNKGL